MSPQETDENGQVLIITGMSGAGRSTVGKVLEDLGWFVVDNLPPQMLSHLRELANDPAAGFSKVAVTVDVRGGTFFNELQGALTEIRAAGGKPRVLFLGANDEVLVRRFESVRRPHPLQGAGRILDGIRQERDLVADLRASADVVIDTSSLNVHQLAARVVETFAEGGPAKLRLTVMSFGFKYGIPVDADHVVDVRFLPNPFWIPELRALTGRDDAVRNYVLAQPEADDFVPKYVSALEPIMKGYLHENRTYVTVAVGCTGGKHRSVAIAEKLSEELKDDQVTVGILHRDLGRE